MTSDAKPSQAIWASRGTCMRVADGAYQDRPSPDLRQRRQYRHADGAGEVSAKLLDGIEQPALMAVFPYQKQGKTVVLNFGANLACDGSMLAQFFVMGAVMAEHIVG